MNTGNHLYHPSRRFFLSNLASGGALFYLSPYFPFRPPKYFRNFILPQKLQGMDPPYKKLDFTPANWIWYPSQRTLPNTFILFRKEIQLDTGVHSAKGWILADSRYLLSLNGNRVQFGPAPSDPRFPDADPVDLTGLLKPGKNVIGIQVLFYGLGDGTWPIGKPGFIFNLEIEKKDGSRERMTSDPTWQAHLARSWQPGHYKRWYLRALQEDFDARLYPYGWDLPGFTTDETWIPAMRVEGPSDKPSICLDYNDYLFEINGDKNESAIFERNIPLLDEHPIPVSLLTEVHHLKWLRPAEDYFDMVTPGCYLATPSIPGRSTGQDLSWEFEIPAGNSLLLTFELSEQMVGFPYFTIFAPEGTIIELLVHEAHQKGLEYPLMNTHFNSWTRFTCREGNNYFETFDFECFRWMQLHIRKVTGKIMVSNPGIRRRMYRWPNGPGLKVDDGALQKVINASVNTLYNCAQETLVDGMGRERQQYSGDVGHQLHALFYTFGDTRLPARYLNTFSQGLTHDGYFLDCWPAWDRLARVMERQLNLTSWGPILDHSIGFNFDCYHYYLYTDDLLALKEVYPRLVVFKNYLRELASKHDDLLPVEDLGIPSVWIDHDAYRKQKHKQCPFNLYASAMLGQAFAGLASVLEDEENKKDAEELSAVLLKNTIRKFWDPGRNLFINNLPWIREENEVRICDRSLSTAILFDQIPGRDFSTSVKTLGNLPPELGLSYPANAGWRYWALAKSGRMEVVIRELRDRWAQLPSVILNNTLQEAWQAEPDSTAQWSHCPVAPLYMMYMGILGLHPLEPGFKKFRIWPQLSEIEFLDITAHTVKGPVRFISKGKKGNREIRLQIPEKTECHLWLPEQEKIRYPETGLSVFPGHRSYKLEGVKNIELKLSHT